MKTLFLMVTLVLGWAGMTPQIIPCTGPCTVDPATVVSVQFDHDGLNVTGYRIYLDSFKVGPDIPANMRVNGVVTVGVATPTSGVHQLQATAYNATSEAGSSVISLTVTTPPTPPPPPPPPPPPAQAVNPPTSLRVVTGTALPPPPPPPTGSIPSGWDDPRFANLTTRAQNGASSSGTIRNFQTIVTNGDPILGCRNFSALVFRLQGREGVRVCGGDVLIEDFYLRITGSGDDHADGIQHYIGSPGTQLRDRNGNNGYQLIARRGVIETNGVCTAGLFSADGSQGRIWLEDVKFIGSCKGLRVNVDGGGPVSCVRCVFNNPPQVDVAVDVWENNTMANGTPVPRP